MSNKHHLTHAINTLAKHRGNSGHAADDLLEQGILIGPNREAMARTLRRWMRDHAFDYDIALAQVQRDSENRMQGWTDGYLAGWKAHAEKYHREQLAALDALAANPRRK